MVPPSAEVVLEPRGLRKLVVVVPTGVAERREVPLVTAAVVVDAGRVVFWDTAGVALVAAAAATAGRGGGGRGGAAAGREGAPADDGALMVEDAAGLLGKV
jgi:hypothetical protein